MAALTESSGGSALKCMDSADSASMMRKMSLVASIQETIERNGWSQRQAAKKLGMPQPKLCNMFKGQWHGISEFKLLSYLTNLGSDIRIVVNNPSASTDCPPGSITVEFV